MLQRDLLKTIIADGQEMDHSHLWQRRLEVPLHTGKIITLVGVRRSGKTSHLFATINRLLAQGVDPRAVVYLNFEDERLSLTGSQLDEILQAHQEMFPDLHHNDCYFFFDEIQEVPGWEKFIARMDASVSKNIFLTGSNSRFLSRDIATALRGRALTFEVYPFSFSEVAAVRVTGVNTTTSRGAATYTRAFDDFLTSGGFPEVIQSAIAGNDVGSMMLQENFSVMLFRDLVERYQITQVAALRYLCKRAIASTATQFSPHRIFNDLKSQGYKISKDTVYSFVDQIESIYLARFVPRYTESLAKAQSAPTKVYAIDHGMSVAMDFKAAGDLGRLLETAIGLELLKSGHTIRYVQDAGSECDFVVVDRDAVTQAIQVCYDLSNDRTRAREIKGLVRACQRFGLPRGTLVTRHEAFTETVAGVEITALPAWRFCLDL